MIKTELGLGKYGASIFGIGPAGENMVRHACIIGDAGHSASHNGLGAVMGAKGLKAIIVDDTGAPGVQVADKAVFDTGRKKLAKALQSHDVTKPGGGLNTYGTAVLVNILNEAGALPTRNFSSGRFEGAAKISGEAINEACTKRGGKGMVGHACSPGRDRRMVIGPSMRSASKAWVG